MWPKWLQNSRGSVAAENKLLREQNDLLRLLVKQQGLTLPPAPRVVDAPPRRKLTSADVTRVTRQSILEAQQAREEALRLSSLNDVQENPNQTTDSNLGSAPKTPPESSHD